jgi:hypothetical protein
MRNSGIVVVVSQHYPPDSSTTAAIMSVIAGHLALGAPVLVLSGTSGSASTQPENSNEPNVIEIKNWMPGKAALIKRATPDILFIVRGELLIVRGELLRSQ